MTPARRAGTAGRGVARHPTQRPVRAAARSSRIGGDLRDWPLQETLMHVVILVFVALCTTVAFQGSWADALVEHNWSASDAEASSWATRNVDLWLPGLVTLGMGITFGLGAARAPVFVFAGMQTLLLAMTVIESDRLNWFAFFSGVSFRLVEGPVPLRRSLFGALALIATYLFVLRHGVRGFARDLARRGVDPQVVSRARRLLMERLWGVAAVVVAAAVVLVFVAAISMGMTEGAPQGTASAGFPTLVVALLVLACGALAAWSLHVRRIRRGAPSAKSAPGP